MSLGWIAPILGWLGGMLVNYLADVLPTRRRLCAPFCQNCQSDLGWVNALLWPRRCAACGRPRGWRSWLVEAIAVAAATGLWLKQPRLGFWVSLVLVLYFGLVVVIDLEHRLILHPVSLAGAVLGLGVGIWLHGWKSTLLGGLAGFGSMLALYILGGLFVSLIARLRGRSINEIALGFGDVNLSGVLGLLLGWPGVFAGLMLTILLGGLASLIYIVFMLIARRYQAFSAIPYGPFMAASAVLLLIR